VRLNNGVPRPGQSRFFGGGQYSQQITNRTAGFYENRFFWADEFHSMPEGTEPPLSFAPARKGGSLSSYGNISGSGDLTYAHLAMGKACTSTITGSGTISSSNLSLIVQLAGTLAGTGDISQATLQAISSLSATLAGNGTISAAQLGAIVQLAATLSGNGTISAATMKGILSMSASITVSDIAGLVIVGTTTKQEVAEEVLTSQLSAYSDTGNVAEGIENAGSAGNPWAALTADNNDPGTFGAFIQKLLTVAKFLGLK
jgi:hypothetical protein